MTFSETTLARQQSAPVTGTASPFDIRDLRTRTQHSIDEFLERYEQPLLTIGPELAPIYASAASLLSGGKRLRAAACYWGWRAVAAPDTIDALDIAAVTAASSLEFVHACALAHDDVMDASDTRRGQPTAHRTFEAMHRDGVWRGSASHFGEGAAILIGDLLLSWADEVLFTSGLPLDALMRGKPVFDVMRTELMAGQYLDLMEQASGDGTEDRVMRVARYKTAKYTVERPLHLGGALAGATPQVLAAYSDYGLPLGEAFQLRDDVLGVFGDPAVTGKPAGDDLREGKRTLLIHETLNVATPEQRRDLEAALGRRDLTTADIEQLRTLIVACGALEHVEARIESLRAESLAALTTVDLDAEAASVLAQIVDAATRREA